jgi:hypothetical protein
MLEAGHLTNVEFDHFTAAWIPKTWHAKIQRVPAPAECRIWGRQWPIGGDCCLWTGANDGKRNGRVHGVCRDPETKEKVYIHRLALARHLGVSISALDNVDHICRNATCFNPYHLEDTAPKENTERGDGVLYQFKPKDGYGESTISEEDLAALASGHIGSYRR